MCKFYSVYGASFNSRFSHLRSVLAEMNALRNPLRFQPNHYWSWIFGDNYNGNKVVVNKQTLKSDFFKLKNDFYGGIEMNKFYMSNNGMFISSISAIELLAAFEKVLKNNDISTKERNKIESLKKSLNENDNEVLFVGEIF